MCVFFFRYATPDCSFVYDASYTPEITAVTTTRFNNEAVAGDEVIIEGTGFVGSNTVQIGGSTCAVTSENETSIKCTVGHMKAGESISKIYTTPLFFKMAQNLDLRCVLVPAPWVLGPKHVSNPE